MPFVKIDCGILNSTLWFDKDARDVFMTALLMAEPMELREPTPQFQSKGFDQTGFVVPPGWYGFVPAASVGIFNRAKVDDEAGFQALDKLGAPESNSRTPDFDGRRMVRVEGGFIILNYDKYRERDYTAADRMRRYRERTLRRNEGELRRNVTAEQRHVTQAEVEVQEEERTPDRSTYRTSDRNLMSSVLRENTAQQNQVGLVPQKTQGIGALPSGSLPRDHMRHSVCGKQYRICIPPSTYAKFSRRYGPDDAIAKPAIQSFVDALEDQLGDKSVGDYLWLEKHYDAWLIQTGRVTEPAKAKSAKKTTAEIVAEVKALHAKEEARRAKNKAANQVRR